MIECIFCGKEIPDWRFANNAEEVFCSDFCEIEFREKVGIPPHKRIIRARSDGPNLAMINKNLIVRIKLVD